MVLTFLWHGKVWSKAWSFRFLIIDFGVAYLTGRTRMNKLAPDGCAALLKVIKSNPLLLRLYKKERSKSSWYPYSWFLATAWRAMTRVSTHSILQVFLTSLEPFSFYITEIPAKPQASQIFSKDNVVKEKFHNTYKCFKTMVLKITRKFFQVIHACFQGFWALKWLIPLNFSSLPIQNK